jgi:hypothetical protein
MHPSVIARLEELTRKESLMTPRFNAQERSQLAWELDLTEETKVFAEKTFTSDAEAAAAGFRKFEETDGQKRYYEARKKALELSDEECSALSDAVVFSRGAAVSAVAGRILVVFGILFVLAFALGGILHGAEHKSWFRLLLILLPGVFGGLLMYWVGHLIGEVRSLRGMLRRMSRRP